MALSYDQWEMNGTTKREWRVTDKAATVNDVGIDDTLSFTLDKTVMPATIKITIFSCVHGTLHLANEWTVVCSRVAANEVKGTMGIAAKEFRIVSSVVKKGKKEHNKLTVYDPAALRDPDPGGGVCWTAEDG